MGTLQENQSLNAEYERNKKEREMKEEIERLQEELKYTIPIVEHNQTIQSNINSYNKLAEYSKELEDRINKAIEYIEMYDKKGNDLVFSMKASDDLIDILKGSEPNE